MAQSVCVCNIAIVEIQWVLGNEFGRWILVVVNIRKPRRDIEIFFLLGRCRGPRYYLEDPEIIKKISMSPRGFRANKLDTKRWTVENGTI